MIKQEDNPEFLNSFLDYSITSLNKSMNSVKEYNYDLMMFLRFIKMHFHMTDETDLKAIKINDITIDTIKKIKLDDILAQEFENILDEKCSTISIELSEMFTYGFKIGAKMMIEILQENKE